METLDGVRMGQGEPYGRRPGQGCADVELPGEGVWAALRRDLPWEALCDLIAPVYPQRKPNFQPPPLLQMVRILCVEVQLGLPDTLVLQAIAEQPALRRFVGYPRSGLPSRLAVFGFHCLLERAGLLDRAIAILRAQPAPHAAGDGSGVPPDSAARQGAPATAD